jgi:hypothetical protein
MCSDVSDQKAVTTLTKVQEHRGRAASAEALERLWPALCGGCRKRHPSMKDQIWAIMYLLYISLQE